jgi:hypothetical protein
MRELAKIAFWAWLLLSVLWLLGFHLAGVW